MGGPYSGGDFGGRDRSHGKNGRHTPESDRSTERRGSPSYDSYDRREPDRRGRSPSPSYDRYDDRHDNSSQRPRRRVSPRNPDSRGALGPTADQEEEDLKMALRLNMRHSPPKPKQSKPRDATAAAGGLLPEDGHRMQWELMAAAAEKRMLAARSAGAASPPSPAPSPSQSPSI